ncbi:unnamed protein product [Rangifer tarandus platyrhynchus]|uniref:Uncharacterized protein n=1 Tax=Rangifer tarandus platyrhynchus TaxID=3082113 RepID=A0AC59Z6V9_RANTA
MISKSQPWTLRIEELPRQRAQLVQRPRGSNWLDDLKEPKESQVGRDAEERWEERQVRAQTLWFTERHLKLGRYNTHPLIKQEDILRASSIPHPAWLISPVEKGFLPFHELGY